MTARQSKLEARIGLGTMIFSIIGFFWYGSALHLFGSKIHLDLKELGFALWLVAGMFGLGFAIDGARAGLKYAIGFALLIAAAIGIGAAAGNYR